MNKGTELKLLKEQLQQLTEKVQAFEKETQEDIWKDGHWATASGNPYNFNDVPPQFAANLGWCFTTRERCQAWIDYQKACVVLRDACKPYLTEEFDRAYIPTINAKGKATCIGATRPIPLYLWVNDNDKALEIAEQCKAELLIIQNFKWDI